MNPMPVCDKPMIRPRGFAKFPNPGLFVIFTLVFGFALTVQPGNAKEIVDTPSDFAILMDGETGQVLYEKNADTLMSPASMTKLMTLTMVFERLQSGELSLDDEFVISENAWRKGGFKSGSSTMGAEVNSSIRLEDLLRGIIVQSGNDACIAVAEGIAGTEEAFADMMTARARELGLEQATFVNSTGWPDPNHRMTARELGLLARYMLQTFPEHIPLFGEQNFTWNGIQQGNRNPLIYTFQGATGLKTGHTEDSGYGLVGTAKRGDREVILVVNGLTSDRLRAREAKRLMSLAFTSFVREPLYEAGDAIGSVDVFQGQSTRVRVVTDQNVQAYLHRAARRDIKIKLTYQDPLKAPITAGQEIGTMTVLAPGFEGEPIPVFAEADVPALGLFGKAALAIKHLVLPEEPEAGSTAPADTQTDGE